VGLTAREAVTWPARLALPGAGLLLDLDGTLLDSEPVHQCAYRQYFAGRGWHVPDRVLQKFSGRRGAEAFASLPGPWDGEDPLVLTAGVLDLLRATDLRPAPVAGAARLLAACRQVCLPFAVVTSARRGWLGAALDLLGVDPGGILMVTAEDCSAGKPDPEPYRRGADLLGGAPADLVAVEDAPAGIASARGAGVGRVIGMTTSRPARDLLAAGADDTAPDLVTLAGVVEDLERR